MSPSYEKPMHLFVLLILTLAAATVASSDVSFHPSAEAAAAAHCGGTLYPELCLSTLITIPNLHKKTLPVVIGTTCNRTETQVTTMSANCSSFLGQRSLTARDRMALSDCKELLDTTMDDLRVTISDLERQPSATRRLTVDHVMTVLAAWRQNSGHKVAA